MQKDTFTNDYLQAAQNAAATRAYKLAARMGMTREEREDITQELLTDLLAQAPHYNPIRGSVGTFTGAVSKNRATELLDRYVKDKMRLSFVSTVAANDEGDDQSDVLEKGGVVPFWSVDADLVGLSMALYDMDKAVQKMRTDQVDLLELLLTHESMAAACRAFGGSTPTFYRRVSDLKMHLRMFGIKAGD
jgi:DNA-directed RNA polymerase specialized sigma24 family protein